MTAYDCTNGLNDGNFQAHDLGQAVLTRVLDFAKATTTGVAATAADTVDVITIPAGFMVEAVATKVITASTTTASVFGVGDTSDSVFYIAASTSATSVAGTIVATGAGASGKFNDITSTTTLANSFLKFYSAADKLRVLMGTTAPLNGKVQFTVIGRKAF